MTNVPAPAADEPVVDEANEDEDTPQAVLDALGSDTKGAVTANEEPDLDLEASEDEEGEEEKKPDEPDPKPTETEAPADKDKPAEAGKVEAPPATEEPEADPAGVYSPTPTEDPGDFKPRDYSFEVRTTDGKTSKITTPEDADNFIAQLDDNPELLSASQFSNFTAKRAVMEQGIATDKREYDTNKTSFEAQQAKEAAQTKMLVGIDGGFKYLQAQGKLPELPPEMEVDGAWEKNPDSPGVKERLELLAYMNKDNEERMKHGLEPSFDVTAAYNAMRLESMETTNKEAEKADKKDRQKRGGMVGKPASYAPTATRAGSITGLGGTLNDLVNDFTNG